MLNKEEQKNIEKIYNTLLKKLKEEDRDLPQIKSLL